MAKPRKHVEPESSGDLLAGVAPKPTQEVMPPKKKQAVAVRTRHTPAERVELPAPKSSGLDLVRALAEAAANPAVNPEKMRVLLDMRNEIKREDAKEAFTRAFVTASAKLPMINAKGKLEIKKNDKVIQSNRYATYNEINKITKPILRDYGLVLWNEPAIGTDGKTIIRTHLDHEEGFGIQCEIALPLDTSGSKNNVQGVGSAISYGKRYGAIAILNLISDATEDRDDDGVAAGKVSKAQEQERVEEVRALTETEAKSLRDAIADCGVGEDTFCNKYEITRIEDLPPALLKEAMTACKSFKAKRAQTGQATRAQPNA
jgi:hypothetical protein